MILFAFSKKRKKTIMPSFQRYSCAPTAKRKITEERKALIAISINKKKMKSFNSHSYQTRAVWMGRRVDKAGVSKYSKSLQKQLECHPVAFSPKETVSTNWKCSMMARTGPSTSDDGTGWPVFSATATSECLQTVTNSNVYCLQQHDAGCPPKISAIKVYAQRPIVCVQLRTQHLLARRNYNEAHR